MMRSFLMLFTLLCILACFVKCAWGGEVTLVWDTPPAAEQIRAWKVFRGIEAFPPTEQPRITLTLPDDQISTIQVRAENSIGEHSDPAEITLVPVRMQESAGLKAWSNIGKVTFREAKTKLFFRIQYLTP